MRYSNWFGALLPFHACNASSSPRSCLLKSSIAMDVGKVDHGSNLTGHQAKWIPHARWGWKLQSTINIWQPTRYNTWDSCCATLAIPIWAQELHPVYTEGDTRGNKIDPSRVACYRVLQILVMLFVLCLANVLSPSAYNFVRTRKESERTYG